MTDPKDQKLTDSRLNDEEIEFIKKKMKELAKEDIAPPADPLPPVTPPLISRRQQEVNDKDKKIKELEKKLADIEKAKYEKLFESLPEKVKEKYKEDKPSLEKLEGMIETMSDDPSSPFVSDKTSTDGKNRNSYPIALNLETGKPDVKYL